MTFQLNYAALLDPIRNVGVGLVLAGLVGTFLKDVSSWVGLLGVIRGTVLYTRRRFRTCQGGVMEDYAPYVALLLIAVGLGGPAVYGLLKGRRDPRDHAKK